MSYSIEAYHQGEDDAVQHILAGRLALEVLLQPWGCYPEYAPVLNTLCGVESKIVGGCMVNDEMLGHRAGYNAVMEAEIMRRFGPDVIERAEADAYAADKPIPAPPISQWHAVWMVPLMIILLLLAVVLWPLSRLVARIRGTSDVYQPVDPSAPRWGACLTRFISRVFNRLFFS